MKYICDFFFLFMEEKWSMNYCILNQDQFLRLKYLRTLFQSLYLISLRQYSEKVVPWNQGAHQNVESRGSAILRMETWTELLVSVINSRNRFSLSKDSNERFPRNHSYVRVRWDTLFIWIFIHSPRSVWFFFFFQILTIIQNTMYLCFENSFYSLQNA